MLFPWFADGSAILKAIHRTAELHERTIGRAVDAVESLAQDETLAQLLELKSGGPIYVEREERRKSMEV